MKGSSTQGAALLFCLLFYFCTMKKKILLTGGSGFLGANLCHFHSRELDIHAVYHTHTFHMPGVQTHACDLADEAAVAQLLDTVRPEAVIHLAALSDPNQCQLRPQESYLQNVTVAAQMARLAAQRKIQFLAASTDLVFDGHRGPYKEDDPMRPVSIYGRHKAEMEVRVASAYPAAVICRLPLMYGAQYAAGRSFLQPMLEKLVKGETVALFTDEYRTPSSAHDVCRGLLLCLALGKGIYHLGGERVSRYAFGEAVCRVWNFDASLLKPSLQREVTMPAPRPPDVSLDSSKIHDLGWTAHSLEEALKDIRAETKQPLGLYAE